MVRTLALMPRKTLCWVATVPDTTSTYLPDTYQDAPSSFSWPVSRDDIVGVRNKFMASMISYAKEKKHPDHELYPVLSLLWINDIIQCYHFLNACNDIRQNGKEPNLNGDTGFMHAAWNQTPPTIPPYVNILEDGPKKPNPVLETLRGIKRYFAHSPVSYKPTILMNFDHDIVVNSIGELIIRHAEVNKQNIYYVPRSQWFRSTQKASSGSNPDSDTFIAIVKACFSDKSALLTEPFETWLREIYLRTICACSIHIKRLNDAPEALPKKLWIGSGGVMWDRILKYVVKKNGGTVTGHDHGSGVGHFKSISRALSECNDCDTFIPFSQDATLFPRAIDQDYLFDKMPQIQTLPAVHQKAPNTALKGENTIKKILIIPYGPDGNTARFVVTPHDSIKVDFLVRTIEKLNHWGYEVHIKPHPHCPMPLNADYLKEHNVTLHQDTIASAFFDTDAALFLHCYTTTFKEAFTHNMPLILIDSQYETWTDGALEKLQKRCSVIKSKYDSQNRINLDWEALHNGIKEAPKKNDSAYFDTYYN